MHISIFCSARCQDRGGCLQWKSAIAIARWHEMTMKDDIYQVSRCAEAAALSRRSAIASARKTKRRLLSSVSPSFSPFLWLSLSLSLSLGFPWQSYVCISLSRSPSRHKYGFATSSLGLSRKSRACVAKRPNRRPKNPSRRSSRLPRLEIRESGRRKPSFHNE